MDAVLSPDTMTIPATIHPLSLPTPFPVGPVNVYLIDGDPLTLVDTGPKADISRAALKAGLGALGHRLEDIQRLILTHHHADHIGLAGEIVARSGAEIWTHPYNFPWLADYAAEQERARPFYESLWQAGAVPPDIVAAIETASASIPKWVDPTPANQAIDEGDTVELGGQHWQVFHTPGHAGGLICLWEPDSRTLLSNDHLIRDISSNPVLEAPPILAAPRPRRLVEYLHHLRRMAALDPALALAGHGEPVTAAAALVRQRQMLHQRRADRILAGLDGTQTLWEMTRRMFPYVHRGMDYFLALSEMLGHLDLLVEQGRATQSQASGRLSWSRV